MSSLDLKRTLRGRSMLPLETLEARRLLSTINVLNLDDAGTGSLRQAVLDANAHPGQDTIRFGPKVAGTISLSSELGITDDLKINGPGADRTTLNGGGATRIFSISGDIDVLIAGLTIADGRVTNATLALGGGILNSGASLTLNDVTLSGNQAIAEGAANAAGGGIANVNGASLRVGRSQFRSNLVVGGSDAASGYAYGGAIYNDGGSTLEVHASSFVANQATGGASHFGSRGGAIANTGGSVTTVVASDFQDNLARGADGQPGARGGTAGGGAIVNLSPVAAGPSLIIRGSTFVGNQAVGGQAGAMGGPTGQGQGGAINTVLVGSETLIEGSAFTANRAVGGPGNASGGDPNGGLAVGGALEVLSASLTVRGSRFTANQAVGGDGSSAGDGAPGQGGALSMGSNAPGTLSHVTVSDSTFTENRAVGGNGGAVPVPTNRMGAGGAIQVDFGSFALSHSTLLANQAIGGQGSGAGGWAVGGGMLFGTGNPVPVFSFSVDHSLLADNVAQGGTGATGADGGPAFGGGINNTRTNVVVSDTVLLRNQAVGGTGGNGGLAQGGGFFNMGPGPNFPAATATLANTFITQNQAKGGDAGAGGVAGVGIGGGVFNGGTITIDDTDLIVGNVADQFADCFGC